MRLRTHPDPCVLEDALLRRIDEAHVRQGVGSTCVLVPTLRLATHLQTSLLKLRPAWLGLELFSFRSLARSILLTSGTTPPELLGPALYRELVRTAVEQFPDSQIADRVRRRPGTLVRLVATFRELRDAGVDAAAAALRFEDEGGELAELYRAVQVRLDRALADGWTDDAGLVATALPSARAYAARRSAIFLHGAAELTGVHTELLHELDRGQSVEAYLLHHDRSPAFVFADRFARQYLAADAGSISALATPESAAGRADASALFDEECRPAAPTSVAFSSAHAQGPAAEFFEAIQQALVAVGQGTAPGRIGIVARTLEPYAAAIEQSAQDDELSIESSLTGPLRRHPRVGELLSVLRAVADDFPRRTTAALLRSPLLRWRNLPGLDGRPAGLLADEWSRKARIVGGLEEWNALLPTVRTADPQAVEEILRTLRALRNAFPASPRGWREHAVLLRDRLAFWFDPREESGPDRRAVENLLDEMERIDRVLGRTEPVPLSAMVAWLEQEIGGMSVPILQTPGGIQVLDAMQARGMTFDRLFLLGMNSGVFPRPPREDALLSDRAREALRRDTSRPLPVKHHGSAEERWLLASVLGAARGVLHVSWQRADESGRARTASLALREIARWAGEEPDIDAAILRATHLPSHPLQAIEDRIERLGLVSPEERRLHAALRRGERERGQLVAEFPELSDGIRMLQATQSFVPNDLRFDGRVGPPNRLRKLSVSRFETLARCPLQFFFRSRLGIRTPEEEADVLELSARELGTAVHDSLETLYRRLAEEGLLEGDSTAAVARARELAGSTPGMLLGAFGERLRRRLPVLGRRLDEVWRAAILQLLAEDLPRWMDDGWQLADLETDVETTLSVDDRELTLRGRLDRVLTLDQRRRVGDYKTSGNFSKRMKPTEMLRGNALQVPLYSFMNGGAEVELIGVGPAYEGKPAAERRTLFDGWDPELEPSFRDTLVSLGRLAVDGRYPLRIGNHCNWCEFRNGCRRDHPPTRAREEQAGDRDDLLRLARKSTKTPFPKPTERGRA